MPHRSGRRKEHGSSPSNDVGNRSLRLGNLAWRINLRQGLNRLLLEYQVVLLIFRHLSDDRRSLLFMRLVCRAWRSFVSVLPDVSITWRSTKAGLLASRDAIRKAVTNYEGLTGLYLGSYELYADDVEALGMWVGTRLRHLQLRVRSPMASVKEVTVRRKPEPMRHFTRLESLHVVDIAWSVDVKVIRLGYAVPIFSLLNTLHLFGHCLPLGHTTRFPTLTSLSVSDMTLISHPAVRSNLTYLCFTGSYKPGVIADSLLLPNLMELRIHSPQEDLVPFLPDSVPQVKALTLLDGDVSLAFISKFPNLRYLDISAPRDRDRPSWRRDSAIVWDLRDIPKLPQLETLRAIDAPLNYIIEVVRILI